MRQTPKSPRNSSDPNVDASYSEHGGYDVLTHEEFRPREIPFGSRLIACSDPDAGSFTWLIALEPRGGDALRDALHGPCLAITQHANDLFSLGFSDGNEASSCGYMSQQTAVEGLRDLIAVSASAGASEAARRRRMH